MLTTPQSSQGRSGGMSSVITQQVTNGIAVRMAVLFRLLVGSDSAGAHL